MSDDSICATWNRLVVEGEELVLHNASSGCPDLVSVADIRERDLTHRHQHKRTLWQRIRHSLENISDGSHPVSAVWVPSGDSSDREGHSFVDPTEVRVGGRGRRDIFAT
jgi:hypothetical protein